MRLETPSCPQASSVPTSRFVQDAIWYLLPQLHELRRIYNFGPDAGVLLSLETGTGQVETKLKYFSGSMYVYPFLSQAKIRYVKVFHSYLTYFQVVRSRHHLVNERSSAKATSRPSRNTKRESHPVDSRAPRKDNHPSNQASPTRIQSSPIPVHNQKNMPMYTIQSASHVDSVHFSSFQVKSIRIRTPRTPSLEN